MSTESPFLQWPVSATEAMRLEDLRSLEMLDTPAEEPFDGIVEVAAALFEVPVVALTLMDADRQWFKAKVGTELRENRRELAFCQYAVLGRESMVIEDLSVDDRFRAHPFVVGGPQVRFYAGAVLLTERGHCVGTLCILDVKTRRLEQKQVRLLERLARQAVDALETRRLIRLMDEERKKILDLSRLRA